jgi:hypothetical protein
MINIKTIQYSNKNVKREFSSKKHYKLVILIIASRAPHYDIFTHCWMQYMNKFPEVKSFFLYADENIENDLYIDEYSITYKDKESYIPGILFKTLAAKKFCQKYLSYNHILRTNLSSLVHIPRLLKYLDKQSPNDFMCTNLEYFPLVLKDEDFDVNDKCITNILEYNKENWKKYTATLKDFFGYKTFLEKNSKFYFLAGSFYIMTGDVVDKLLYEVMNNNILFNANVYMIPDDLAISAIVQLKSIQPRRFNSTGSYCNRCKNIENPKDYNDSIFHIRNRTDLTLGNRNVDVMNIVEQVRYYYDMPNFLLDEDEKKETE